MDFSDKKKYCADVKKVKQWLHSTNERCNSLNYHMKYLKILYQDMPKIQESKQALNKVDWQDSKIKDSNNDETVTSKQMNCNNSLEDCNSQYTFIHESDDMNQKMESFTVPNLSNNPSKIDLQHNENEVSEETKQKEPELCSVTPRTYNVSQSMHTRSNSLSPRNPTENTVCEEEHNHNWQHPYQKHLAEYSTELVENIEDSKDTLEQLLQDNQNEYLLRELASARDALRLNISENGSTDKGKVKNEKKEKGMSSALASKRGSLSKLDNMVSLKIKKRRKKVHSSNSRSTVTTRDTNYLGRKEPKKRKQKNTLTNRHTYKPNQTSNEVVEIYHNKAVKGGSTSAIPSKHSKLDHHMNYINILTSSAMNKQQAAKAKCEENNYQHGRELDVNNLQNSQKQQHHSKQKTEGRTTNTNDANYNLEVSSAPLPSMDKCNTHKCQHAVIQASYCDPMVTHNYEMPTLASKLKRVDRAYFARFHFRNIPFVVGNSMATSHNLGLNIQEVCKVREILRHE